MCHPHTELIKEYIAAIVRINRCKLCDQLLITQLTITISSAHPQLAAAAAEFANIQPMVTVRVELVEFLP